MSLLAIAFAASGGEVSVAAPVPDEPLQQSVEIAIASLDTGRGIAGGYERWFPQLRFTFELRGEIRESASGDYTGMRYGTGLEAKWFFRARHEAWLSVVPAGNPVGWFVGAGIYAAVDTTHDDVDHRWLGTALQLGDAVRVGYRIAPWRQLTITPSTGIEIQRDLDLSGRLAGAWRYGISYGLDVGWLF